MTPAESSASAGALRITVLADSRAIFGTDNRRLDGVDDHFWWQHLKARGVAGRERVDVAVLARPLASMRTLHVDVGLDHGVRQAVADADVVVLALGLGDCQPWLFGPYVAYRIKSIARKRPRQLAGNLYTASCRALSTLTGGVLPFTTDATFDLLSRRVVATLRSLNPDAVILSLSLGQLQQRDRSVERLFEGKAVMRRVQERVRRRSGPLRAALESANGSLVDVGDLEDAMLSDSPDGIHFTRELHQAIGARVGAALDDVVGQPVRGSSPPQRLG